MYYTLKNHGKSPVSGVLTITVETLKPYITRITDISEPAIHRHDALTGIKREEENSSSLIEIESPYGLNSIVLNNHTVPLPVCWNGSEYIPLDNVFHLKNGNIKITSIKMVANGKYHVRFTYILKPKTQKRPPKNNTTVPSILEEINFAVSNSFGRVDSGTIRINTRNKKTQASLISTARENTINNSAKKTKKKNSSHCGGKITATIKSSA